MGASLRKGLLAGSRGVPISRKPFVMSLERVFNNSYSDFVKIIEVSIKQLVPFRCCKLQIRERMADTEGTKGLSDPLGDSGLEATCLMINFYHK